MIRDVEEVKDGLLQDLLLLEAEVVTAQTEHTHWLLHPLGQGLNSFSFIYNSGSGFLSGMRIHITAIYNIFFYSSTPLCYFVSIHLSNVVVVQSKLLLFNM